MLGQTIWTTFCADIAIVYILSELDETIGCHSSGSWKLYETIHLDHVTTLAPYVGTTQKTY